MFDGIPESEMSIGPLCDSLANTNQKELVPLDINLNFYRCIFNYFEFNLRELVYEFPHKGKQKEKNK